MTPSIKRLTITLILIFTTNLFVFSQKIIFDSIQGDTSFCLTKTQSQFLIQKYYKAQELAQTVSIKDTIIELQDSTISFLEQQNALLKSNSQKTNNANLYLQEQVNIKDEQNTKISKQNKSLKSVCKISIPIIIIESFIIYLQNK